MVSNKTKIIVIGIFFFVFCNILTSPLMAYKFQKNDQAFQPLYFPNDPLFYKQWSLEQDNDCDIDMSKAWDITRGSPDVVIAIIDTGVNYNLPDLKDNIWINEDEIPENDIDDDNNGYIDDIHGWNFNENNNEPLDDCSPIGHGTICASIAAAVTNNNRGIAGIASNCKIMVLKMGYGVENKIKPINYATENGADIISMSWAFLYTDQEDINEFKNAIDSAYNEGVVLVTSAGNSDMDISEMNYIYPAAFENVITVAATDKYDKRAKQVAPSWASNYGKIVDVASPGEEIFALTYKGIYSKICSGTSFACPHVSGIIALLLSNEPDITNEKVINRIKNSVDMIETDKYIGTGRINAYCALSGCPGKPYKPTGDTVVEINKEYVFSTSTLDPNEDQLSYLFDWGDGTDSGWIGAFDSGEKCEVSHTWTEKGTFKVKVKAKDKTGQESEWSNTLSVSLSKSKTTEKSFIFKWIQNLLDTCRFSLLTELIYS